MLQVQTDTGQVIDRGYSFDLDLLIQPIDPEESARWDELPVILRDAGYHRTRDFQWEKNIGEVSIRMDLFIPDDTPEAPTGMTRLPRGERVIARANRLHVPLGERSVDVKVPSIVDFVLMKLDAPNLRTRKTTKDAFDLYAYARKKGSTIVGQELARARERDEALAKIQSLFGYEGSPGVLDVLSFAPTLEGNDKLLVIRDIVRTFTEVRRVALRASR